MKNDLKEEQAYMKKWFPKSIMRDTFELFGEQMIWNHANGIRIAQEINNSSRISDFYGDRMIYDVTAQMQMGKSTAILSAIAKLMMSNQDEDFLLCYYLCSSNKSVVKQFQKEAETFFGALENFRAETSSDRTCIIRDDQTTTMFFIHNTSAQSLKKRVSSSFRAHIHSDSIKILLFDEADQSLGKDSKRDQFLQEILNTENVYDPKALTTRQNSKIIEVWIGATNFFPNFKGRTELQQIYKRIDLMQHPKYYGLKEISLNGYLFDKTNHDIEEVIAKHCNSNPEYDQYSRPVGFVRIQKGNKNSFSFYEKSILQNVNKKCAFTTDYGEFCELKQDDETEVIVVHFNASKNFSHDNLKDMLSGLESTTKLTKKQNLNFNRLDKKIIVIVSGTLKEGNNLLNKNSHNISFLWENMTENTKKYETPIQQAGRICKIGDGDPPLLFTDKKIADALDCFINQISRLNGENVRWAKGTRKSFEDLKNVFFMKKTGFSSHEDARVDIKNICAEFGNTSSCRYGRFKSKDHKSIYQEKIYPAVDYWHNNNFLGKKEISEIKIQGKGKSGGVSYVEQDASGKYSFCLIFLLTEEDEFMKNYADLNPDSCSFMKYVDKHDAINMVEDAKKLNMLCIA